MKNAVRKAKNFWLRLAKWTQITVLVIVVLVVGIRLALPSIVKHYVNKQLNKSPEYRGSVADIDIWLIRGAYKIKGLKMEKNTGAVPVPFITVPLMDLSIEWKELFHGSMVGEVVMDRPQVNFVNGKSDQDSQTGEGKDWKKTLEDLFPFRINRFQIREGDIRFRDFDRNPKVDIFVTNLFATATNLSNSRSVKDELPAGLVARGDTIGHGLLVMNIHMNPLAEAPTFKLATAVSNMDLTALNDFMRAYGKFDVAKGTFEAYTEVAAAHGHYEGYVKPFFKDLQVFEWDKERGKNILQKFWEAIVAGVSEILRNQPKNQLATKIPIAGDFKTGSKVGVMSSIGGILKNAFIRALLPKLDSSVNFKDVEQKTRAPNQPPPPTTDKK